MSEVSIVPGVKNGRKYWWTVYTSAGARPVFCPHLHVTQAEARECAEIIGQQLGFTGRDRLRADRLNAERKGPDG